MTLDRFTNNLAQEDRREQIISPIYKVAELFLSQMLVKVVERVHKKILESIIKKTISLISCEHQLPSHVDSGKLLIYLV